MNNIIKVAKPFIGKEEEDAVIEVLRSGNYVSGKKVSLFEKSFADYIGTYYAVGVSSGTSAIYLTLQALGIGEGDEVIVPAMTFFSTATAVLRVGATPIFADIESDTYCLDPTDTFKKINSKTRAIIPVHFYGGVAELDHFWMMTRDTDIHIIEDAAQAHGAEFHGRKVGSFGTAGTWSFFATKNMCTGVESGMVTTNDEEIANTIKILRTHGMTDRNTHALLGFNDRMDEIAAAVGLVQLGKLDAMNEVRIENSMYLREQLKTVAWLKIPPIPSHVKHVFFWANFEVDEEKLGMTTAQLRKRLLEKGIETRHRYVSPLYKQPILKKFQHLHDYSNDFCPNAEKICGRVLGLPNHPLLVDSELSRVVESVKEI